MEENICKQNNWQGFDLQNIQTPHTVPTLKKKNQKLGRWTK